jgi:glycerol-3-phosphate dehydrogenase subunit B
MTSAARHHRCELAVIGSGIAGFAASIFATNRRLSTAQVGNTGAIAYTTGYLDLLGAVSGESQALTDPGRG